MTEPIPVVDAAHVAWTLKVTRSTDLPPMAWVLRARAPIAQMACGDLVRRIGEGVFEGTWTGESGEDGILGSTTTFGSGVLVDRGSLVIVPPSHLLEAVYVSERADVLFASNSFPGLLAAAQLELDPRVDYPQVFAQSGDGIFRFSVPTLSEPVVVVLYEPMRLGADGSTTIASRPREAPFTSFEDYRTRLAGALSSAVANAPGFEPVATISSGYDSASMATLARDAGCRRAVTIAEGKPVSGSDRVSDSGEFVGRSLGMEVKSYDRLAYQRRDDLPEAEFMATGMSGEDVVFSSMGPDLHKAVLVTGFYGDGVWWLHMPKRALFWRLEQAGTSLGEFRLRTGFVHVAMPWFGAAQIASVQAIGRSDEMRPWFLGIGEDRPIPRRILEEAGIPRGRFAEAKRGVSARIHSHGPEALAPATVVSLRRFAAAEGRGLHFRNWPFPRWRRFAWRKARRLGAQRLADWLERPRRKAVRHDAQFGNLLLRWAVDVVRPRYADVEHRWRS